MRATTVAGMLERALNKAKGCRDPQGGKGPQGAMLREPPFDAQATRVQERLGTVSEIKRKKVFERPKGS